MLSGFSVPPKKTIVAIAAAASLTLLAGCSDDGDDIVPPPPAQSSVPGLSPSEPSGNEPDTAPARSAEDANKALDAAGDLALGEVADSTLVSIESENDGAQWEVKVVTPDGVEHELDTNADGSEQVGETKVEEDDTQENQVRVKAAKLDFKQAADKILDEVPGGEIRELNLDDEGGKTVWEADVMVDSTKHEVQIDAGSGDVLKNKTDG